MGSWPQTTSGRSARTRRTSVRRKSVRVGELAVGEAQVLHAAQSPISADDASSSAARSGRQLGGLHVGVGRALAAVGAHDEVHGAARLGPAGQGAAAGRRRRRRDGRRRPGRRRASPSITCAWAPSSWSAGPPRAGSRRPPRSPCRRWRSAGRPRRRAPAAARARPTPTCWLVGSVVSARSASSTPWASSSICSSVTGRFLQAAAHALDDLGPIEGLTQAAALDHPQRDLLDPLERGEAAPATEALASAADGTAVLGLARIHDAVVIDTAPGTPHTADDSQGMKMCSPGTTDASSRPRRASCRAARRRAPDRPWLAMEASVSPAFTMYSCPWRRRGLGQGASAEGRGSAGQAAPAGSPARLHHGQTTRRRRTRGEGATPRRVVGQDVQPGAVRLEIELKCDRHGVSLFRTPVRYAATIGSRTPVRCQPVKRTAVRAWPAPYALAVTLRSLLT